MVIDQLANSEPIVAASVAESVHFCAAPAPVPACQKFLLWLQLRLQLPIYFRKKSKKFIISKNYHAFKKHK
jgi:hypothetical protein